MGDGRWCWHHRVPPTFRDALIDLLLGGHCVGCGSPGRLLCPPCDDSLPAGEGVPRPAWPTPVPAGLAPPFAAAAYDGVVRELVIGHKEHRLLALRDPLARLLAVAVRAAGAAAHTAGPLVLVPVPSRPGSVRARGHDPTGCLAVRTGSLLRGDGADTITLPMLLSRPGVVDQAGLGAGARSANLAGSMYCPDRALRRLRRLRVRARIVVCDDVITTGSTAREAQRALESVGLQVVAIAAVAATRRRSPGAAVSAPWSVTGSSPARAVESWAPRLSSQPSTH